MPTATMATKVDASAGYKSTNQYLGLANEKLAKVFTQRTIDNAVPYIRPVLDSLPPNFTLLDVGCGPCSITINIAQDYPHATIIGLDAPESLAVARSNISAAGVENIRLVPGDALDIAAALSTSEELSALYRRGFDMAHTHQVHEHVQNAPRLMKQLHDAVRPDGGVVCCRELDMGTDVMYPVLPALTRFRIMFRQMILNKGQDPYVGRKLLSHALMAGFKREDIEATVGTWAYSKPEERERFIQPMLTGFISEETVARNKRDFDAVGMDERTLEETRNALREWAKCEDGYNVLVNGQVVCRRRA